MSVFDRIPKRPGVPAAALAGGVMFACIPLTPAMGLVGVPEVQNDVAQASAVVADPPPDYRSPVAAMASAQEKRRILAAQAAKQRALEIEAAQKQAALLAAGGGTGGTTAFSTNGTPVTTGGPIPTTEVTAKTRQIQKLVRKYFPADQLGNAMAVSACESGHSDAKGAVNSDGTIDWGVFQLNDGGTLQGALDAIGVSYSSIAEARQLALQTGTNIKAAAQIYAARGWAPWVCAYKIGVVGGLYSNTPGPMDGKFDQWGKPTVKTPVVIVDPGTTDESPPAKPKPKPNHSKKPKPKPEPAPTDQPTGQPTPRPTPSRTPSPSPVPSTSQSPTASPPSSPGPAASGN